MNGTELSELEIKINQTFDKTIELIKKESLFNWKDLAIHLGITNSTLSLKVNGLKGNKFTPSQKMKLIQKVKDVGKKIEKI